MQALNNIESFIKSPAMDRPGRIVICESNPILAEGILNALQSASFLKTFTITSGTDLDRGALSSLPPDVLVIDPWQHAEAGISASDVFAPLSAMMSLVGYCSATTPLDASMLSLVGFRGLVPKTVQSEELARVIMAVALGGVYLHESFLPAIAPIPATRLSDIEEVHDLTEREAEVLRHVALGSSMKEIATLLHISTKTVDTYKNRANQKLNLRSRSDIVRYAIQSGWMN